MYANFFSTPMVQNFFTFPSNFSAFFSFVLELNYCLRKIKNYGFFNRASQRTAYILRRPYVGMLPLDRSF